MIQSIKTIIRFIRESIQATKDFDMSLGFFVLEQEVPFNKKWQKEQFAIAWQKQSYLMFDNLGLYVSRNRTKSYSLQTYLIAQLNGTGRLSRLWCRHIRPKLLKEEQAALERAIRTVSRNINEERKVLIWEQAKDMGYVGDLEK